LANPTANPVKAVLIITGLILSVLSCEVFLRIYGYATRPRLDPKQEVIAERSDNDRVRIICIGDSYTFGIGAQQGSSYPDQLQALLDSSQPGKFKVYNLGLPGSNSSMVLKRLPEWMKRYRPDIILVLTGINDAWNFDESNYYVYLKDSGSLGARLKRFLFHFKTYKLFELAMLNHSRVPAAAAGSAGADHSYDRELFDAYGSISTDPEKTKSICEDVIAKDPGNPRAHKILGRAYDTELDYVSAERCYKRALELDPKADVYRSLYDLYGRWNKIEEQKVILEKMLMLSPDNESIFAAYVFGIPDNSQRELFTRLLSGNLEMMLEQAKSGKARLIVQDYPWQRQFITDTVESFAAAKHVPVVRNTEAFGGLDNKEYQAADGHPNEKGYRLMAEDIFKEMIKLDKSEHLGANGGQASPTEQGYRFR